jgi:hypothetical protein
LKIGFDKRLAGEERQNSPQRPIFYQNAADPGSNPLICPVLRGQMGSKMLPHRIQHASASKLNRMVLL